MPNETRDAVTWALVQVGVAIDEPWTVVDAVREYFNAHGIEYSTFSFDDLVPYLPG